MLNNDWNNYLERLTVMERSAIHPPELQGTLQTPLRMVAVSPRIAAIEQTGK